MVKRETFSLADVQLLRSRARQAATLPNDVPEGWSKSTIDPMAVLAVFDSLWIKPGYQLRAFQFRERSNGNGFVWAMPAEADLPEPRECPRVSGVHFLNPHKPPAALDDVMEAVQGDGSPWSYLCASLLARELGEFGAVWHGCDWSLHTILGENPLQYPANSGGRYRLGPPDEWTWLEPTPRLWQPQVAVRGISFFGRSARLPLLGGRKVEVTFFTFSELDVEAIYRHIDRYLPGTYQFDRYEGRIATGGPGICL